MANTLNQLKKLQAQEMTRGDNVLVALSAGLPIQNKEIAAQVVGSVGLTVAAELLIDSTPVGPVLTGLRIVGEWLGAQVICIGVQSAIKGRHNWAAAIGGSLADEIKHEQKQEAKQKQAKKDREGALDSNLKPTSNKVTDWDRSEAAVDEFVRQHGYERLHLVRTE